MKAVIQRVSRASVSVAGEKVGEIGLGLLALLGVAREDVEEDLEFLADKLATLRIFEDDEGKMNLSLLDVGGELLVVSQFTLLADSTRGRRPSFFDAMAPEDAEAMVGRFVTRLKWKGLKVEQGVFGAMMDVELNNQGPVTIILDSTIKRKKR